MLYYGFQYKPNKLPQMSLEYRMLLTLLVRSF
jgi:hypothetical protein